MLYYLNFAYTKALSIDTEDNQSRLIAVEELVRIDKSKLNFVASVLIAGLANENEQIRSDSARALGAICASAEDAIPALVKALNDKVVDVRVNVAGALASIDKSKLNLVIPILIKELKNADSSVVGTAIDALTQINEPAKEVVPALVNVLNDEDVDARLASTRALRQIGDSTVVPALIKALNDEDILVQMSAIDALKEIGTPEALKAVEEYEVKWGLR